MRNLSFYVVLLIINLSCTATKVSLEEEKSAIDGVLNSWHHAAAQANFENYFSLMTDDAVFIGTDATENWALQDFKNFSKPYFDKGKAWSFTSLDRNIYVDPTNTKTAWFDELLQTQMGICRGSGVMRMVRGDWKVQHYVLSIAVPNENVEALTALKKDWDMQYQNNLSQKQSTHQKD